METLTLMSALVLKKLYMMPFSMAHLKHMVYILT